MPGSSVADDLFTALCEFPIIDSHSHIDPLVPAAHSLDDLLSYHYYTELAHSAGMPKSALEAAPRDRCRRLMEFAARFDNTVQYAWLEDMARTWLGFEGDRLSSDDAPALFDASVRVMSAPDWPQRVINDSRLERVFLTNQFDDPLDGFDRDFYVPCLRTDDLVFQFDCPLVIGRLGESTGVEPHDTKAMRRAVTILFDRFVAAGARACAISLPPQFVPAPPGDTLTSESVFWLLAESCRNFNLPFDLMIGVNRGVYRDGVYQGRDLFDQRTSLNQFAELFNHFPEVTFCVSVLSAAQQHELASYAWIFPNVLPHGHWWYTNLPPYIEPDLRARLAGVPKTKLLGYYSDAYKLEFVLPKFNMYRRVLAEVLAGDFVRPHRLAETQAVELGRLILRGNAERVFRLH